MKKIRNTLLISVMTIALFGVVFFHFKLFVTIGKTKNEIKSLKETHEILVKKNENREIYDYERKYIAYEKERIKTVLPPDIMQEYSIMALNRIEAASGVRMTQIAFSEPVSLEAEKKEAEKKTEESKENENNEANEKTETNGTKGSNGKKEAKSTFLLSPLRESPFQDGERLVMPVSVSFRAPYDRMKKMLEEIANEKNRVIVQSVRLQSTGTTNALIGHFELMFYALKDSEFTLDDWELQLEKGISDLFRPFDGYSMTEDIYLPDMEKKQEAKKPESDFYLIASGFNAKKPAVLVGKYNRIDSETFYDGNGEIDLNIYVEENNGHFYYRTRTRYAPFPDETNRVIFFPKEEEITMDIIASSIA